MRKMLERLKNILIVLTCWGCLLGNTSWAANWPTDIVLSEIENAPAGTIIASVPVNKKIDSITISLSGEFYAFLGFSQELPNYGDPSLGIFKLTEELGIAFTEDISVTVNRLWSDSKTERFHKSVINTPMESNVVSRADAAGFNILTGVLMKNPGVGDSYVEISGNVVLVKLTNGSITPSTITLPNIQAMVCGGWQGFQYQFADVLVSGGGTTIINPRVCEVSLLTSPSINFGTFFSNHPPGLMLGNIETQIGIHCNGTSNTDTPVYLEVIPTNNVAGDSRAIGLTISGDTKTPSDSLVVKAKRNPDDTTACTTEKGGWLALATRHQMLTLPKNKEVIEFDEANISIYWSLCKLKEEDLPSGTFSGSATLSITFN